jgi:hypothetical protein
MDCELLNRAREYRLKLLFRDSECDLLEAAGRRTGPIDDLTSVEKMAHQYLQRSGQEDDCSDEEDDVIVDDYSVRIQALVHCCAVSSSLLLTSFTFIIFHDMPILRLLYLLLSCSCHFIFLSLVLSK